MLHKLPSLFPWKHNKTKIMAEPVLEDETHLAEELAPCGICGRTFFPGPLDKHIRVCEKNATKKRKPFNSLKQRVEGTDLAVFHQRSYLKEKKPPEAVRPEPTTPQYIPGKEPNKWKEKHIELVNTIRAAKGVPTEVIAPTAHRRSSTSISSTQHERCPSCERFFGPKAFDRHVEWCKEHKARLPKSPAITQEAKERLDARIKYRVPPLNKTKVRQTVKEKYSPGKVETVQSVKSISNLERRPSNAAQFNKHEVHSKVDCHRSNDGKVDNGHRTNEVHSKADSYRNDVHSKVDSYRNDVHSKVDSYRNDVHSKVDSYRSDVHGKADSYRNDVHSKVDSHRTNEAHGKVESFNSKSEKGDSKPTTPYQDTNRQQKLDPLKGSNNNSQNMFKQSLKNINSTAVNLSAELTVSKLNKQTTNNVILNNSNAHVICNIENHKTGSDANKLITWKDTVIKKQGKPIKINKPKEIVEIHLVDSLDEICLSDDSIDAKNIKSFDISDNFKRNKVDSPKTKENINKATNSAKNGFLNSLNPLIEVSESTSSELSLPRNGMKMKNFVRELVSHPNKVQKIDAKLEKELTLLGDSAINLCIDFEKVASELDIKEDTLLYNEDQFAPTTNNDNIICNDLHEENTNNLENKMHKLRNVIKNNNITDESEKLDNAQNQNVLVTFGYPSFNGNQTNDDEPRGVLNKIDYDALKAETFNKFMEEFHSFNGDNFKCSDTLKSAMLSLANSDFSNNKVDTLLKDIPDHSLYIGDESKENEITENISPDNIKVVENVPTLNSQKRHFSKYVAPVYENLAPEVSGRKHIISWAQKNSIDLIIPDQSLTPLDSNDAIIPQINGCNAPVNSVISQDLMENISQVENISYESRMDDGFGCSSDDILSDIYNISQENVYEFGVSSEINPDFKFECRNEVQDLMESDSLENLVKLSQVSDNSSKKYFGSLDQIPMKLSKIPIKIANKDVECFVQTNVTSKQYPPMMMDEPLERLNLDSVDTIIFMKNCDSLGDLESIQGTYENVYSNALSKARLEQDMRKCCSQVHINLDTGCEYHVTYSDTNLDTFNSLENAMQSTSIDDATTDEILKIAGEEFLQEQYSRKGNKYCMTDTSTESVPPKKRKIQELSPPPSPEKPLKNCVKIIEIEDCIEYKPASPSLASSEECVMKTQIREIEDCIEYEPTLPSLASSHESVMKTQIKEIEDCIEYEAAVPSLASSHEIVMKTQINEIEDCIEYEAALASLDSSEESVMKIQINEIEDCIEYEAALPSLDSSEENVMKTQMLPYAISRTSSSSIEELSPRVLMIIDRVLDNASESVDDVLHITKRQCQQMLNLNPNKLNKLRCKNRSRKKSSKSAARQKLQSPPHLTLPKIEKKRIANSATETPKKLEIEDTFTLPEICNKRIGSHKDTNTSSPEYNPYITAERQLMELLQCDDFTPFKPTAPSSITRPHTTGTQNRQNTIQNPTQTQKSAPISAKNLNKPANYKRASVIDPPVDFSDRQKRDNYFRNSINVDDTTNDILEENFELIENFINDNFNDDDEENKIDSLISNTNGNNNLESLFSRYNEDLSIDPRLINEYDNLSIPDHFQIENTSPDTDLLPEINLKSFSMNNKYFGDDLYSLQYDKKICASEQIILPKTDTRKKSLDRELNLDEIMNSLDEIDKMSLNLHKKSSVDANNKRPKTAQKLSPDPNLSCSYGLGSPITARKKNLSSLKRTISLLDPVVKPLKNLKSKADVQNYFHEREVEKSPKKEELMPNKSIELDDIMSGGDLFSVDDVMYEEYKKYEQMYLQEKEEKLKKEHKINTDDENVSIKMSGDSAYGSLSRSKPKVRGRVTKLSPLEHRSASRVDSASSSGSETSAPRSQTMSNLTTTLTSNDSNNKISKFCHECGNKYPLTTAKFCIECGVKRLVL